MKAAVPPPTAPSVNALHAPATNAAVAELIDGVNRVGGRNQWDAKRLRECVREFLENVAEEAVRFPATAPKAQWTLFAADDDRTQEVAFVVVVVSSERGVLMAGRGAWEAVRDHGENFLAEDAFDIVPETKTLFPATGSPVELSRAAFDEWVASETV